MFHVSNLGKFFVVACLSGLIGCANKGSVVLKEITEAEVDAKISAGKTKRDEIRAAFGSPLETSFTDGGLEIWKYEFEDGTLLNVETVASGILTLGLAGSKFEGTKKELIVLFDDNYVVRRYNMSESPVQRGTGIF